MRITKFWAKGYRSLRDVTLDDLGAFNVFYGPNGSGKSNVLAAIEALFRWTSIATAASHHEPVESEDGELLIPLASFSAGTDVLAITRDEDFFAQATTREIVLGCHLTFPARDPLRPPPPLVDEHESIELRVELKLNVSARRVAELKFSSIRIDGRPIGVAKFEPFSTWCHTTLTPAAFGMVDAVRALPNEIEPVHVDPTTDGQDSVQADLQAGRLKSALFAAKNFPRGEVRFRFEQLQRLMSNELGRPGFDVVRDPKTREIDLREMLPPPNPNHVDVPLGRAGLGVVQVYAIIATMLFARRRAIGLEEPEAHLHAPTMGRLLRKALAAMVAGEQQEEPLLDQLFIATHSNLFDLDETGYWDVSLDAATGETRVVRKPLSEIDRLHLVEPGPARHILQRMLQRYGDEFVFRDKDGRRYSATEMLAALQREEPVAMEFLRTMHETALETMAMRAQDEPGAAS